MDIDLFNEFVRRNAEFVLRRLTVAERYRVIQRDLFSDFVRRNAEILLNLLFVRHNAEFVLHLLR